MALMPEHIDVAHVASGYTIYPFHSLGEGKVLSGYESLANWIIEQKTVVIDGYGGVFWNNIKAGLANEFEKKQVLVRWYESAEYLKDESEIEVLTNSFLGDQHSVWGTKTTLELHDFFRLNELEKINPDNSCDINIVIGVGAYLVNWDFPLIYIDLAKNELQYRMRAGSITNLGKAIAENPVIMYKRFYFIDWVVLNKHKESLLRKMSVIADAQWVNSINWAISANVFSGLQKLSKSVFRVRPWFDAGAWGGQWIKKHVQQLNQDEINYAWSFEFIVPENGLVFESDGNLLEISFDFLMFSAYQSVLGQHAEQFKTEFPIRFDFLDTFDGGNLSIQCHPSLKYIQETFGETITQDETYYILDCKEDAVVYLGFQERIEPDKFRQVLEESVADGKEVDIEQYVQIHPAKRHDLFLIPNGTIHSAGTNNLVLEISATPYIFTFKIYDWLRMGLDGEPRPINIEHAFKNLNFDRKGAKVVEELISKPVIVEEGIDWKLIHLPTHAEHFYDIHRIEFTSEFIVVNENICHVLMLVEGSSIAIETADGTKAVFNFAETFVVPAAAKGYKLINKGEGIAKVVKAFLKTAG